MAKAAYKYLIELISGQIKKSHDITWCHRKESERTTLIPS